MVKPRHSGNFWPEEIVDLKSHQYDQVVWSAFSSASIDFASSIICLEMNNSNHEYSFEFSFRIIGPESENVSLDGSNTIGEQLTVAYFEVVLCIIKIINFKIPVNS